MPVQCHSSCSQHRQFCSDASCFPAQCIKCNLITHKRHLASSLFSTNSVIVMGHPKHESACGNTALQLTKQQSQRGLQSSARLSLQMCCSPCRCAVPLALTRTPALSLLLFFKKDKSFRSGVCATIRLMGTLLCSNWLNLCGMWFHSADLDCAAKARHTLA